MFAQPQQEHQWLRKLVGEWTYENECSMGPDQPPIKSTGTDSVRSLGGLWFICEGRGAIPGGDLGYTIMSLGYDPDKKRFVGTFVGSMFTNLWVYDGALQENVLTLDTIGPSFAGDGKLKKYQDIIELVSDDHRILRSQVLGGDGKWTYFMTAHYRRKK